MEKKQIENNSFKEKRMMVAQSRHENDIIETVEAMQRRKLVKIKYVGIEFDPKKITKCEDMVNVALENGYQPITDYQTPVGLVMVLGIWTEA